MPDVTDGHVLTANSAVGGGIEWAAPVGGAVDAEDVTVDSTTLVGTGTDVQAVLEELDNGIADHLADTTDAHDATAISFAPAGTIAATTVQAAIEEVALEASGGVEWEDVGAAAGGISDDLAGAWVSYTPDLTASSVNPTDGAGATSTGAYKHAGRMVWVRIAFNWGGAGLNPGSGYYRFSVPVTGAAGGSFDAIGPCGFTQDISTGARRLLSAFWDDTNRDRFGFTTETGNVTNNSPYTWATGDQFLLQFFYEAATDS